MSTQKVQLSEHRMREWLVLTIALSVALASPIGGIILMIVSGWWSR